MGRDPLTRLSTPQEAAFRLARRTFVSGQRVELADLAATLGVNRVTVHRWLGNRTQVLTDVVWSLTQPELERCYAEAPGHGGQRVATALATHARDIFDHDGFSTFLEREHETALRVLTRRDHDFQRRIVGLVEDLLVRERDAGHPVPDHPLDDLAYLAVRVLEAFVYVERIVGEQPDPERADRALHFLLR